MVNFSCTKASSYSKDQPEGLEEYQAIASSEVSSPLQKLESTVYNFFVLVSKLSKFF